MTSRLLIEQEACHPSEELCREIQPLYEYRKVTIAKLYAIAEDLNKHHFNVNVSKDVGGFVGVTGRVIGVVGLALTPVTAGGSVALTIIGSGTAAVGGLTTTGAGIAENIISKLELREAQQVIQADRAKVEVVKQNWQRFETLIPKITDKARKSQEDDTTVDAMKWLKRTWCGFTESNSGQSAMFLWNICTKAARLVFFTRDVQQVINLGLEEFAGKQHWLTDWIGRCGYIVFKTVFLCIGLVVDTGTLIYTLYNTCRGSKSKSALELQEKVEELEEEQRMWTQLLSGMDNHE